MIKIISLLKKYHKNIILDIKKFEFAEGQTYLLVGSNGCGKSTLIKTIIGIANRSYGEIEKTVEISYVPERFIFPSNSTVLNFLLSINALYKKTDNFSANINELCQYWDLDKSKKMMHLSKGMQQKILIIQAQIHNSSIYIFDEPLNGLDLISQNKFYQVIKRLQIEKKTIIIATHYPSNYPIDNYRLVKLDNGELYEESL